MKGCKQPNGTHRYLAIDGLYYNGYFGSYDHLEDFANVPDIKALWAKIIAELEQELLLESKGKRKMPDWF